MNLSTKVVLITGGARIGAVVAEELAKKGCHVALSYRHSRQSSIETAGVVRRHGVRAEIFRGDMTNSVDVTRVIAGIKKTFGRLDILVNMASTYGETKFSTLRDKEWEAAIASNLTSAHLTVLRAAALLRRRGGRVINFADWVAASGRPRYKNFLPYYTAKAGVIGLTQAQALELAPRVLVNAIAPGPILPPAHVKNEEVRAIKKVTPLGKWGGAMEIAKAVLFLCETDFVTGECLRVDGGRHLY